MKGKEIKPKKEKKRGKKLLALFVVLFVTYKA